MGCLKDVVNSNNLSFMYLVSYFLVPGSQITIRLHWRRTLIKYYFIERENCTDFSSSMPSQRSN